MAKSIRRPEPKSFDEAQLEIMVEPLTVRVVKKVSGREMPVELPIKPGESVAGKGWTKDEVRQIDSFLLNNWSGGGLYAITVVDSQGQQLKHEPYFPPERFPEKTPPSMSAAASPTVGGGNGMGGVSVTPPPPMPPLGLHAAPPPSPLHPPSYSPPTWLQTVPPAQSAPPAQSVYPWGMGYYPQGPGSSPLRPGGVDEVRAEREERLRLESRLELERIQSQHNQQMAQLQQELRRLAEQPRAGADDRVAELQRQLEEERRARQTDERIAAVQRQTEQMLQAIQQSTQQQMAALQTMIQQLAQAPKGPDPMLMMLIEAQKSQAQAQVEAAKATADAQRESARLAADVQREQQRNTIGPREMIDLMGRMNMGQEQLANAYTRVLELTHSAVDHALQIQGPGVHPALQMIGETAQGGLQLAKEYMDAKKASEENRLRAHVQTESVRAQAQVATAQAQLAAAQAMPQMPPPEPLANEPPPVPTGDELEARERQLFAGAYDAVMRLRVGVAEKRLSPAQAAEALMQGIAQAQKMELVIPAFDLWRTKRIAELVEVLVPDATTAFKDQFAGAIFEFAQRQGVDLRVVDGGRAGTQRGGDEDEDEENDEEEDGV